MLYLYTKCMQVLWSPEEGSDPQGLELQKVVNARNQMPGLCKSINALSCYHLSNPLEPFKVNLK